MANDFKHVSERCLVWETEKPFRNRNRESPTFTYRGMKCHLVLRVNTYSEYILDSIKDKGTVTQPDDINAITVMKSLSTNIQLMRDTESCGGFLWRYFSKELSEKIQEFDGLWRFYILFDDDVIDCSIRNKAGDDQREEKSVQTPSCLSTTSCLVSLSRDLSKSSEDTLSHDVKLKCGDRIVCAHRHMLSCRSQVFAKMLQSDMAEGRTGLLKIQNMDCELLEPFLRYLYTGTLPELDMDTARQFYEVGDKYAVEGLTRRCSDFLHENLTLENACEMLLLADFYSDRAFKESVMTYILDKKIPLLDEYFSDFSTRYSQLANEVLFRFCKLQANV